MSEDTILFDGGEVKALDEAGKVGGYLVIFSDEKTPDLVGDFFTKNTNFFIDDGASLPVLYDHGLDATLKRRRLGRGTVKVDDVGLWVEAQLELRDDYEKAVYELAKSGKLGWSSGAAGHLTSRTPVKNAKQVMEWGMAEASLTPIPCEPRTSAITLKSYIEGQKQDDTFDDLKAVIPEDTHAGLRFDERLDLVLAAAERVVGDATEIQEMRVKSGRKISQARMTKLKQIMTQLEALVMEGEVMPKEDPPEPKSVDLHSLLASFEQIKFARTKASIA